MTYENKLKKEKTEILHKYSHKVGGKPVYFVKIKEQKKNINLIENIMNLKISSMQN